MRHSSEKLPIRLNRTTIYESPWFNLYRDKVSMPNGHIIEQYHFLDFDRGAVLIIVEDKEGHILMERVSRYPTGLVTWELPAGSIESEESILEAAQREVWEETGYDTCDHQHIYTYHPMNGISNMIAYVVHCKVGQRVGRIDKDEIQEVQWFNIEELQNAIHNREITDGFAITGLLLHMSQFVVRS